MNHISPNMVVQVIDMGLLWGVIPNAENFLQAGNEMRKIDGVVVDANVPQVGAAAAANIQMRVTMCCRRPCVRPVLLRSERACHCGLNL